MEEGFKNFEKQAGRIRDLEDGAELKATVLDVSDKVVSDLVKAYALTPLDHNAIVGDLQKAFTNSITNDKHHLRELAAETIRDTFLKRGIEKPGFRDDYLEALDSRLEVHLP